MSEQNAKLKIKSVGSAVNVGNRLLTFPIALKLKRYDTSCAGSFSLWALAQTIFTQTLWLSSDSV